VRSTLRAVPARYTWSLFLPGVPAFAGYYAGPAEV